MRVSEDRYAKDLQKLALARELLSHGVRTKLICAWTRLTKDRVRKLHRAYDKSNLRRPTGPSYSVPRYYTTDEGLKREAAVLGAICRMLRVFPEHPIKDAANSLPDAMRGEALLLAYAYHQAITPNARISLERALHLAVMLADAQQIALDTCASCGAVMLFDYLGARDTQCFNCRNPPGLADKSSPHVGAENQSDASRQSSLFE